MPWLHEMSWPQVQEYVEKRKPVLIPLGSTEQHGRHAPLGTDSFVAIALAEGASKERDVICVPPLYFGWSPHHLILPGTINIDPDVLYKLLYCMIRSLAYHGLKSFIVINGHRIANLPWIQIGAEMAQRELSVKVAVFDPAYMAKDIASELGFGYLGHGEESETSHMMYIRPELIDLASATDAGDHLRVLFNADPRYPGDTLCYVPGTEVDMKKRVSETGGSSGKPRSASAEMGGRLHTHLVHRLVEVIDSLR